MSGRPATSLACCSKVRPNARSRAPIVRSGQVFLPRMRDIKALRRFWGAAKSLALRTTSATLYASRSKSVGKSQKD